jgi:hypothetical protein
MCRLVSHVYIQIYTWFLTIYRAGFKPFMEYAGSYALFNYRLEDPNAGLEYSNLRLIRAFEHGLDHTSSEAGFVLVHVDTRVIQCRPRKGCTKHDKS